MNLAQYLKDSAIKKADFARSIGVSPDLVYQWVNGIRPIAAQHCPGIVAASNSKITLQDLRPDDWNLFWPAAPAIPTKPARTRRTTVPP